MFLSRYIMAERISKVLGVISGLTIVWIGAMMLWRRYRTLSHGHSHSHNHHDHRLSHDHEHGHSHSHDHGHSHSHDHGHAHEHVHATAHTHDHGHTHSHGGLTHTHDGHTHSHVPEGDISIGSLIALGASGGLVPCPSALILLLSAISIGRVGLGMVLLLAFSLGLAIVLTATGLLVLYAKNLFPERTTEHSAFFRYMPVFSAAVIVLIGVVMTSVSLGWIPTNRFIG
jgi:ABC-type nickel/cobalt efflux system permease component RcnA